MIYEYGNFGTLQSWYDIYRSEYEINSMVFQIFSGLYAMYKNYDLINADLLHLDNIIVLSTNKQEHMTYWEYIYNEKC